MGTENPGLLSFTPSSLEKLGGGREKDCSSFSRLFAPGRDDQRYLCYESLEEPGEKKSYYGEVSSVM